MNVRNILSNAYLQLIATSSTARLDAELLLSYVINQPKTFLYTDPDYELSAEQEIAFSELLLQRQQSKPIAYITGKQAFWTFDLRLTSAVLIPRPETELLVEKILNFLPNDQTCKILELGTGSGAIAIALALERPLWTIIAVDISEAALQVAKSNAVALGAKNIEFYHSDWFQALPEGVLYDCIVSNPPYIAEDDPELDAAVKQYEPRLALIAEKNGLACIEEIIMSAKKFLKTSSYLVLEHGYNQADIVAKILSGQNYKNIEQEKDYAGHIRLTSAQRIHL